MSTPKELLCLGVAALLIVQLCPRATLAYATDPASSSSSDISRIDACDEARSETSDKTVESTPEQIVLDETVHEECADVDVNTPISTESEGDTKQEAEQSAEFSTSATAPADTGFSLPAAHQEETQLWEEAEPPFQAISSFFEEDRALMLQSELNGTTGNEKDGGTKTDLRASATRGWTEPSLSYRGHFANVGWEGWQSSGDLRGGPGKTTLVSLQAFEIVLNQGGESGGITCRAHVQNKGWLGWVSGGATCGTTGQGLDIEAFEIKLTGTIANHYDLRYASDSRPRSNPKNATVVVGFNGETCGTTGQSWSLYNFGARLIKKSWNQIVQVRYENADGSWSGYSNVINGTYAYRDTVSWNRAADVTYQAASISYLADGAATKQVNVYRKQATNTIQVRYQNADGTWGNYSNASSGADRVGATRSWSRAADATYQAGSASITGTQSAQTKQVSIARKSYTTYFDSCGGSAVASKSRLAGSKFVQPSTPTRTGYSFAGWYTKASGGDKVTTSTNTPSSNVTYYAHWNPITYTVRFKANGASGSMSDLALTYDKSASLPQNGFTSNARFIGWNTAADGSGESYTDKQSVKNLSNTQNAVYTLYAQWEQFAALPLSGVNDGPIGQSQAFVILPVFLLMGFFVRKYRIRRRFFADSFVTAMGSRGDNKGARGRHE